MVKSKNSWSPYWWWDIFLLCEVRQKLAWTFVIQLWFLGWTTFSQNLENSPFSTTWRQRRDNAAWGLWLVSGCGKKWLEPFLIPSPLHPILTGGYSEPLWADATRPNTPRCSIRLFITSHRNVDCSTGDPVPTSEWIPTYETSDSTGIFSHATKTEDGDVQALIMNISS